MGDSIQLMSAETCAGRPTHIGRWHFPRGDGWWRVWACARHLDGLTGIRQFGAQTPTEKV
jgi:hypothetical protein